MNPAGYIDMLFVAPRHQRQGVARQLIGYVDAHARQARIAALTADVSIAAGPFFERYGFTVEAEQHPVKAGMQLTNYKMKKNLLGSEVRLSGQLVCHTEDQVATVRDHLPWHLSLTRDEPGCRSFNVTTTNYPLIWQVEEYFEHAAAFEDAGPPTRWWRPGRQEAVSGNILATLEGNCLVSPSRVVIEKLHKHADVEGWRVAQWVALGFKSHVDCWWLRTAPD